MNGFLVLFCAGIDDLPCGLFADKETALQFANEVIEEHDEQDFAGPILSGIKNTFKLDTSTFICMKTVEFKDGCPVAQYIGKTAEDYKP